MPLCVTCVLFILISRVSLVFDRPTKIVLNVHYGCEDEG